MDQQDLMTLDLSGYHTPQSASRASLELLQPHPDYYGQQLPINLA